MNQALLVFAVTCAFAGAARADTSKPAAPALSAADAIAAVCGGKNSMAIEVLGSRHFVPVTIKGPKATVTVRAHIDTGGNTLGLYLQRTAATRLGVRSAAELPRTIQIGGREVTLPKTAGWGISDRADIRGEGISELQIGAGFLSHFLVCIDPAAGRLGLAAPEELTIDATGALPLRGEHMDPGDAVIYPFVKVRLGERDVALLFDTGATTSMLERGILDALHHAHRDWPLLHGAAGDADMIGSVSVEQLLRVPSLQLAGQELGPVLFVERPDQTWPDMFGVADAHGALANDVLNHFKMLLDYAHGRLWLVRTPRPVDRSAVMTRVGVSFVFGSDRCPVVRALTTRGTGADTSLALKKGDVILSIDGKDACRVLYYQVAELLAGAAGERKQLRVRRAGAELEVSAPVRDWFAP